MAESAKKLIYTEVGLAGNDLLRKYGLSGLENPDKVISRKGMSYIEAKVERDTHYTSCLATRRHKLLAKGWRIRAASNNARDLEIRDFVARQIDDMAGSFEADIQGMLEKISKGFSLSEIVYQPIVSKRYQGKIGLKSIRVKPAKYFAFKFDRVGHYDIRQVDPIYSGVTLPREKFIHVINGPNDENPYGDSYGAKAAFWVWLKENGAKFWAVFSERFGMPLVKATMPKKATAEDVTAVDAILEAAQRDTGIRIPEGFTVDFLEAKRTGDANYDNFIERANKEISKLLLGQTLSSEEGKRGQGSYALGQTHAQTMEDYIAFDAADIAVAINEQLIRRLVNLNYITESYPVFEFLGVDMGALITLSQSVGNLINTGMEIPSDWLYQATGIPRPKPGENVLKPTAAPLLTAGVDNRANMQQFADAEADPDFEGLLKKYRSGGGEIWDGYENWLKDQVKKKDLKTMTISEKNMPVQDYADSVADAMLLANLFGRMRSEEEMQKVQGFADDIPSALADAMDFFIAKGVITKSEFMALDAEIRKYAFTVAWTDSDRLLESLKDDLSEALANGLTSDEFLEMTAGTFQRLGMNSRAEWHLNTVYRTNMQTALNEGRVEQIRKADPELFPLLEFVAINDDRVRDSHRQLNGFRAPANDPVWQRITPPLGFNCRCTVRPVYVEEKLKATAGAPAIDPETMPFVGEA